MLQQLLLQLLAAMPQLQQLLLQLLAAMPQLQQQLHHQVKQLSLCTVCPMASVCLTINVCSHVHGIVAQSQLNAIQTGLCWHAGGCYDGWFSPEASAAAAAASG